MSGSTENKLCEQNPPLDGQDAFVESNRCLYCYDAPCIHACPTHINIPGFIKKISTGNLTGSGRTILESNLIGATCARVCPVQELCEGACVLNSEHRPIMIGRLQRYAMDYLYEKGINVLAAAPPTGRRIAVIGAGPAGLSCAGELARRGHAVTVFEKRALSGGLSTYGIIALREPVPVALAEVEMIARLGVKIEEGVEIGRDVSPHWLLGRFEAVFIATGLGGSPVLGVLGEEQVIDGLDYIEKSKLNPADLPKARAVVVIGAGNTAVDCATIARRTGAERVTMVYRRTEREMTAYDHEYRFVQNEGVAFEFLAQPFAVKPGALECLRAELSDADASGRPAPRPIPGSNFDIPADLVIKAIGQQKTSIAALWGLETDRGFIKADGSLRTSVPRIYAGGDCIRAKGAASTVMAAQDGKIAAAAIHDLLTKTEAAHG
ncbi:MAG TPA: NAD(P)-dependent oxidoreductase [Bryobacteraceae bacterium]|nr:NAD(P)-dependent oxidoreductase [Bryobacteraceae bacterium]